MTPTREGSKVQSYEYDPSAPKTQQLQLHLDFFIVSGNPGRPAGTPSTTRLRVGFSRHSLACAWWMDRRKSSYPSHAGPLCSDGTPQSGGDSGGLSGTAAGRHWPTIYDRKTAARAWQRTLRTNISASQGGCEERVGRERGKDRCGFTRSRAFRLHDASTNATRDKGPKRQAARSTRGRIRGEHIHWRTPRVDCRRHQRTHFF